MLNLAGLKELSKERPFAEREAHCKELYDALLICKDTISGSTVDGEMAQVLAQCCFVFHDYLGHTNFGREYKEQVSANLASSLDYLVTKELRRIKPLTDEKALRTIPNIYYFDLDWKLTSLHMLLDTYPDNMENWTRANDILSPRVDPRSLSEGDLQKYDENQKLLFQKFLKKFPKPTRGQLIKMVPKTTYSKEYALTWAKYVVDNGVFLNHRPDIHFFANRILEGMGVGSFVSTYGGLSNI